MTESASDPNFNQLLPPRPESFSQFNELVSQLVGLSERLGQVNVIKSRGREAILGDFDGKTIVDIDCTVSEETRPGKANESKSLLSLSVKRWPAIQPGEQTHMQEPVVRSMADGKIYEDTMDDTQYTFAMSELEEDLPPETMAWVKKVMTETNRASDPEFRSLAVNDLLNQAPSAEELIANNPHKITAENINSYAVSVLEHSSKDARLRCNNGSTLSYYFIDGNEAYWRRNDQEATVNVRVQTADGKHFMYLRFYDGSERLTVALPEYGDYEQIRASLKAAGATLIEKMADFAQDANIRRGVQAPNDITMRLMSTALKAAMDSGVNERYLKR
jgi:hypothetical protein